MVRERIQKKRDSASVAHSTIMSIIMSMDSFISMSFLESMLTDDPSCRTEGQSHVNVVSTVTGKL